MLNQKAITPEARWNVRDQVWLEGKNLSLPHGSAKLAPQHHGPFKIIKVISPVAYELALPPQWKIHPVFHASLLTPYVETSAHGPNFARPPPDLIEGEEEWEVKTILSHRYFGRQKKLQYLVKWRGYPDSDNTWEPVENLHADNLIQDYEHRWQGAARQTVAAIHL